MIFPEVELRGLPILRHSHIYSTQTFLQFFILFDLFIGGHRKKPQALRVLPTFGRSTPSFGSAEFSEVTPPFPVEEYGDSRVVVEASSFQGYPDEQYFNSAMEELRNAGISLEAATPVAIGLNASLASRIRQKCGFAAESGNFGQPLILF